MFINPIIIDNLLFLYNVNFLYNIYFDNLNKSQLM